MTIPPQTSPLPQPEPHILRVWASQMFGEHVFQ